MDRRRFVKKIGIAFASQGISLVVSFVLTLIMPKVLSVGEYSYWQLLLLYTSYTLIASLGIPDGVFVKYGGKEDKIDKESAIYELQNYMVVQLLLCLGLIITAHLLFEEQKKIVLLFASAYIISGNGNRYLQSYFAAIGSIEIYSRAVIFEKVFCLIGVVSLLLFKCLKFEPYCLIYIIASFVTLAYTGYHFIKANGCKRFNFYPQICIPLLKIGIYLMMANFVGTLTVGIARQTVERYWGITEFGKISLSISITNYILYFINQVGLVLYPMLCQDKEESSAYEALSTIVDYALPSIFLLCLPMIIILNWWLPEYQTAIALLPITFIICYSNCKMSLMYNNFLKIYRQEKFILITNIIALLFCVFASYISAKILYSIPLVVLSVAVAMDIKSTLSEYKIAALRNRNVFGKVALQRTIIYLFTGCSMLVSTIFGFFTFLITYSLYLFIYREEVIKTIRLLKRSQV